MNTRSRPGHWRAGSSKAPAISNDEIDTQWRLLESPCSLPDKRALPIPLFVVVVRLALVVGLVEPF